MNAGPDFLAAMVAFIGAVANYTKINTLHALFGGWEKWMQGEVIWDTNAVPGLTANYTISQEDPVFVRDQLADFVIVNQTPQRVPRGNTKAAVVELKCKTVSESIAAFQRRVLLDTTKLRGAITLSGHIPSRTIARCQMILLPLADAATIDAAIIGQLTNAGIPAVDIHSTTTAILPAAGDQFAQLFVWWIQ